MLTAEGMSANQAAYIAARCASNRRPLEIAHKQGVLKLDQEGTIDEFLSRDPHYTFVETLPWSMKRNPRVFNGKHISITRQDNGNLRLNFKPLKVDDDFSVERYAFGVYRELHKALEGLVEKGERSTFGRFVPLGQRINGRRLFQFQ